MPEMKITIYTCLRCGHGTRTKKGNPPVRCGRCKSPNWDRLRVRSKRRDIKNETIPKKLV